MGAFLSSALELYAPYVKDSVLDGRNWLIRRVEQPEVDGKCLAKAASCCNEELFFSEFVCKVALTPYLTV